MSTTPHVQYIYADGLANTIRPTGITYPNGRVLTYAYGTSGGMNDALSRIGSLIDNDDTTHLVDYSHLGQQSFVIADDTEPGVQYTLVSLTGTNDPDTGDIYAGLDRFGRVKDLRWYNASTSTDVVRIQHGYDRAGNRLWRQDPVAASNGKAFDELYTYDGLYRLKDMQRGTLNGTHTAINTGTETFAQCWTLDSTGNWQGMKQADTGGAWSLEQARTANPVNEITAITNSVGSAWAQPAYDPAGNMTTIPQPADPTEEYTATYDAWNMLTKLVDPATSNTVQENQYDGRRFRVVRKDYAAGVLSEERHFYYTSGWQSIEERLGSTPDTASPECQYVWGLRYIDDCLLRDRDSSNTGTLDERLYALQDPNWNVVAITDDSGTMQERYAYSAYGVPEFLTAAFGSRTTSDFAWETLYCGYQLDPGGLYCVRNRIYQQSLGVWCQRDMLFYVDGMSVYAAWFVPSGTDPYGLAKTCIFSMDANPTDCKRWEPECKKWKDRVGGAYYRKVHHKASIIDRIRQNKCCNIAFVGHQGGGATNGGVVTYPRKRATTVILPDPIFESQLKAAFSANNCGECAISIIACSKQEPSSKSTRQNIANGTGCIVHGAVPDNKWDGFITIGACPAQKWFTLDPKGKASPEDNADFEKHGFCAGPVPFENFMPQR